MKNIEHPYKKIFIANDHAGVDLKKELVSSYPELPWEDLGTGTRDSVDYPDYAAKLCLALEKNLGDSCGILICGSGQGMAMRANRFPFIRAALVWNEEVAKLAREHNDANVLCLPGRIIGLHLARQIVEAFLQTPFAAGRHSQRVDKLRC